MVAIRRKNVLISGSDGSRDRLLYADNDTEPFAGVRPYTTAQPGRRENDPPEEVTRYESWGPAGISRGHEWRSDAELAQVVAYRAVHEPPVQQPDVPDPEPDVPDVDAPDAWALGATYVAALEDIPELDLRRKTSGSIYTPESLANALIDSATMPLIDEASELPNRVERVQALLAMTVCEPAIGSAALVLPAIRRLGHRVAVEATGLADPPALVVADATREVVGRCMYGLDLATSAAELAKLAFWLLTFDPDRPNLYLDHKIRVGNGLLGALPKHIVDGIPDKAFAALPSDDKKTTTEMRRRNSKERAARDGLFAVEIDTSNTDVADGFAMVARMVADNPADVVVQRMLDEGFRRRLDHRRLVADAWCAAFVQPKVWESALTQAVFERLATDPDDSALVPVIDMVRRETATFRFFHYHLEWPHIFCVPKGQP
jgi:hypothetical protein